MKWHARQCWLVCIYYHHIIFQQPCKPTYTDSDRRANLIHPRLISTTCAAFPRLGWSGCFSATIERELALKPWCHTSTFEIPNWKEGVESNFARDVRNNVVMAEFE